jgi:hypothetical protein
MPFYHTTDEEKYAIEFHECELRDDDAPAIDEPETEYHCPVCHSQALQYTMAYALAEGDAATELFSCGQCGAHGEAEDCRIEAEDLVEMLRRGPARETRPAAVAVREVA